MKILCFSDIEPDDREVRLLDWSRHKELTITLKHSLLCIRFLENNTSFDIDIELQVTNPLAFVETFGIINIKSIPPHKWHTLDIFYDIRNSVVSI